MPFKERLIELRKAKGLTQEQLATASGVPLWTLRKYEQGTFTKVPLDVAARLAAALGTNCTAFTEPKKGKRI